MQIKAFIAEVLGTFAILLVFFATSLFVPGADASSWQPAMAIGIATIAMTYGLGQISGGHFNPAITIGLVVGGRFDLADAPVFVLAQMLGAFLAAGLVLIALVYAPQGAGGFAGRSFSQLANQLSASGAFALLAALICEIILTAILLIVVMGATSHSSLMPLAPVAIGLTLTMCYLIAIPLTKASLNPARSTAAALFAGLEYIGLLWIFWVAPLVGACIGGFIARYLYAEH